MTYTRWPWRRAGRLATTCCCYGPGCCPPGVLDRLRDPVRFQLLFNGVLTGLRIVRYDPSTILGLAVAYAPVEDLGFGFALILLTLASWVAWAAARGLTAAHACPHDPASPDRRRPAGAAAAPCARRSSTS